MAEAWHLPGQQPHWDVEMPTLAALSQSQTPPSAPRTSDVNSGLRPKLLRPSHFGRAPEPKARPTGHCTSHTIMNL